MEILYGLYPTYIDVTLKLDPNKDVTIPSNDMKRSLMFGADPLPGIVKHIIIKQNNENIFEADTNVKLILNISKNEYKVIHKNTCLLVEPRQLYFLKKIMEQTYTILKDEWNYVFYCGKGLKSYWENILEKYVNIRELDVDNFSEPRFYSNFFKNKNLWESIKGEYVLTIQADTWIVNDPLYNIYFFMGLNKSYIGGNDHRPFWRELARQGLDFEYSNFNGGLSLRKRLDMIKIIESFPPEQTMEPPSLSTKMETDAEDVYFTIGCKLLNLPLGDDEISSHFCLHNVYKESFFAIHNPNRSVYERITYRYPNLKSHPHF